jgi:hypothetical protein
MMLKDGDVDTTICYFHNPWDRVLVIVATGKMFSYIRAGFSRREPSGIVAGREPDDESLKMSKHVALLNTLKLGCVDCFLHKY